MLKKIGFICALILVLIGVAGWQWLGYRDAATVVFLNVGQGDAIYIRTPNGKDVLIDGGKGEAVLRELSAAMPLWDRDLDLVLATHPDADHIEGLVPVLSRYRVGTILRRVIPSASHLADDFEKVVQDSGARIIDPREQMRITLGENCELFVYPFIQLATEMDTNAQSIVSLFDCMGMRVLLTGDAPVEVERELVREFDLRADVLKAGHHGSRTSTSSELLSELQPRVTIISAGKDNGYGHPHREVMQRLEYFGQRILQTKDGRITCRATAADWDCAQ